MKQCRNQDEIWILEEDRIMKAEVTDADDRWFSAAGWGSCEGAVKISQDQLGLTVFFEEERARKRLRALKALNSDEEED